MTREWRHRIGCEGSALNSATSVNVGAVCATGGPGDRWAPGAKSPRASGGESVYGRQPSGNTDRVPQKMRKGDIVRGCNIGIPA